ncbi:MAG TPA: thiolase family protein [Thermodesulfobacteriota bacterium]|jgi:acetyl-CoA C-acetyltransferase|nr:thiolase family protein [Thermodesulfobacteriota bacterium]
MEKVAIIGIGMTKQERKKESETFADMVFEAVNKALEDAGMTIKDIDNIVIGCNDFWDGRTISSMAVGDASGAWDKNVSCVEGDGTFVAFYGMTRILSGSYRTTLVTAHSKGSESVSSLITNAMFDPIYTRSLGLDAITSSALQARRYMDKYGITEEQCAKVSVKNHRNAKNNPYAQLPLDISVDDVLNSRTLADPIKLLDASPITDGACAVILADEKTAKRFSNRPVWVKGVGFCADAYHLGDRDLAECYSLERATRTAYRMAGIEDPFEGIGVAEVYDAFSYQELMWYEGLGLCEKGGGGKLMDSGKTERGGSLPVNPSGGCLSAHAVIAAGLIRIAEAVLQVRGEAGRRQVAGAKTALAHGVNGPCGQSHCVWILGK